MTPADLFDALFDFSLGEDAAGTSDTPTARQKAAAARCINGAAQEMRDIKPSLFGQRKGWTLQASQSGTVTIDSAGKITNLGGMTLPNDGCTIRFGGALVDSRIYQRPGASDWVLDVPYFGGVSTTAAATIYHDAVLLHRGKERGANNDVIEGVLGQVKFNRKPLTLLAKGEEQASYRNSQSSSRGDYGNGLSGRLQQSLLPTGAPTDCWTELQSFDGTQTALMLRLAPLPAATGTLEARVIAMPARLVAADYNVTSYHLAVPGGMDETVLLPFALKRWIGTPFAKPTATTAAEIQRQYLHARNTLNAWRAAVGNGGVSVAVE